MLSFPSWLAVAVVVLSVMTMADGVAGWAGSSRHLLSQGREKGSTRHSSPPDNDENDDSSFGVCRGQQFSHASVTGERDRREILSTLVTAGAGLAGSGTRKRLALLMVPLTLLVGSPPRTVAATTDADASSYIDPTTDLPKITDKVYFDIAIGSASTTGPTESLRLVIGLFGEVLPRTAQNFRQLCADNAYAGSSFYRVLSDFTLQGGALGDPTGKTSTAPAFAPDNFRVRHTRSGLVSAVRRDAATGEADSRFFIQIPDDASWAENRYAAFGIVLDGDVMVWWLVCLPPLHALINSTLNRTKPYHHEIMRLLPQQLLVWLLLVRQRHSLAPTARTYHPCRRPTCCLSAKPIDADEEESSSSSSSSSSLSAGDSDKSETPVTTARRVNPTVRQHMAYLEQRLELPAADPSWKKTKSYLYRTTLTTAQVTRVVETLLACPLFSPELVRYILQNTPRILRKHPTTHIEPTIDFLMGLFGPQRLAEAVHRKPTLLLTRDTGYNGDDWELVPVFLQSQLGMSQQDVHKLKQSAPRIFQLPVAKLLAVTNYLSQLLQSGYNGEDDSMKDVDDDDNGGGDDGHCDDIKLAMDPQQVQRILAKIVRSHPTLLQLSVDANLQPRVEYLRQRCQLTNQDLSILIQRCTSGVLGLSVQDNLSAKLDLLQKYLVGDSGNDDIDTHTSNQANNKKLSELRVCLLRHPQILGLSLDNLRTKLAYFSSIDSCLPARLLTRAPAVLSLQLENNLRPKIDFLARVWGLSRDHEEGRDVNEENDSNVDPRLGSLLCENPTILTVSLEGNLRPTVDFFNRTDYVDLDANWRVQRADQVGLLRGRYLASSLYKRLLPRWHFAQSRIAAPGTLADTSKAEGQQYHEENQIEPLCKPNVPLHLLASASDKVFCQAMGDEDQSAYSAFQREDYPHLKFSDQFASWLKLGTPIDV
jgi:cyclophilin family peptidyl-prolyl cis-trans isomerase